MIASSETLSGPLGDPRGVPGGPLGVPKFYQDPKTSQGTSRAGLEAFQAFIWYKVINFTLLLLAPTTFKVLKTASLLGAVAAKKLVKHALIFALLLNIIQENPKIPSDALG